MLSRLLRLIGLRSAPASGPASRRPARPRSATAHLFDKRAPQAKPKPQPGSRADGDFNPYNTGKFDRSASWERISKNQR